MTLRQVFQVARHNQLLDANRTGRKCRDAGSALAAATAGGTRLDVFRATVKRDARCGQYYGAQASRVPQLALGIGLPPAFSEAVLAGLTHENEARSILDWAKHRPHAGVLNHLVSGVTLTAAAAAAGLTGLALGALGGVAYGAVGLLQEWRTAHRAALHGASVGGSMGFGTAGALGILASAGVVNRAVAYGLGAISLATRLAGHGVGAALFGAAGVVHGAVAAMAHAPGQHDLPTPRPADDDFAFA